MDDPTALLCRLAKVLRKRLRAASAEVTAATANLPLHMLTATQHQGRVWGGRQPPECQARVCFHTSMSLKP